MKQHLNFQQISEYVMGIAGPLELTHAHECAGCRAEIDVLEAPLKMFRASVYSWGEKNTAASFQTEAVLTLLHDARSISFAAQRTNGNAAGAYSVLIHCAAVLALFMLGSLKPVQDLVNKQIGESVLIAPYIPAHKGGGGGGAREIVEASKGKLPKVAPRQFTPPRVDPLPEPKLPVIAAIVADDVPNVIAQNFGDPLSHLGIPSNGIGAGGGIGIGVGGGIGSARGPGVGPGEGGGFGGGVYRIGGGVSAPILLSKIEPEYSEEARKAKWQGEVGLVVVVDANGKPVSIKVTRSLGLGLDEKAMEAVSQWRFKPGMKDGHAVPVQANIAVTFRLL